MASLKNTSETYGAVARFLHWATAFIVIGLLTLGLYMTGLDLSPEKLALYGLHKSFGTLVLGIAVVRILWKAANPAPHHLATHKPYEVALAKFIHLCLYLALIGMPLSGWLMTSAMDYPHTFFKLFSMPDIYPGKNEGPGRLMALAHEWCAYALIGAVLLHFAGALKHQFADRDATLRRMTGERPLLPMLGLLVVLGLMVAFYYMPRAAAPESAMPSAVVAENVDAPSVAVAAAPVEAPAWGIDADNSYAEFTVTVQGGPFTGRFTGMKGHIAFDPENLPGSSADVTVSIATAASGSAERDDSLRQSPWLAADLFPESRFVTDRIEADGENRYIAHGRLTVRDITLPVEVPFTLVLSTDDVGNKVAKMNGSFAINRLAFGVGQAEWSATDMVADAVNVGVSLTARAEAP